MKNLKLKLNLISASLIGSAHGFGTIIDSDIVYDDFGIPYVPSKRIKGCLRDSALEVCEIFEQAKIEIFDLSRKGDSFQIVDFLFGRAGDEKPAPLIISNLYPPDYENLRQWLLYLTENYGSYFHHEAVLNYFTEIRQQTSIDEKGVCKEGSLRTVRVLSRGFEFEGTVQLLDFPYSSPYSLEDFTILLYFATINLRRFGSKRTRGFGEIKCQLFEGDNKLNYLHKLR